MQLTQFTDYSLRVLLYLSAHRDRPVAIGEIAKAYGISHHHLVKVVQNLSRMEWVATVRGRGGGIRLNREPESITVASVVRSTEPSLDLLECFDAATSTCPLTGACTLQGILTRARNDFIEALEAHTLADLVKPRGVREQLVRLSGVDY